jgi:endo-1,4-beta-xylanase
MYDLPVLIEEFDYNLTNRNSPDRLIYQGQNYKIAMQAALDSNKCLGFTVWGIGDKDSWYEVESGQTKADATPFDDDYQPKLAYYGLLEALFEHLIKANN